MVRHTRRQNIRRVPKRIPNETRFFFLNEINELIYLQFVMQFNFAPTTPGSETT